MYQKIFKNYNTSVHTNTHKIRISQYLKNFQKLRYFHIHINTHKIRTMHYLKNFSKIAILDALTGSFLFSFKGGVLIMERLSTSTSLQGQNYREFFYFRVIYFSLLSTTKSIYFLPRFSFRFLSLLLFCSSTSLYSYLSIYIEITLPLLI